MTLNQANGSFFLDFYRDRWEQERFSAVGVLGWRLAFSEEEAASEDGCAELRKWNQIQGPMCVPGSSAVSHFKCHLLAWDVPSPPAPRRRACFPQRRGFALPVWPLG